MPPPWREPRSTRTTTGTAPTATTAHSTTTPASAATHSGHAARTCTRTASPLTVSTGSSNAWAEAKNNMGIRRVKAIEVKPAAISGEAVRRQVRIAGARFHTPCAQPARHNHRGRRLTGTGPSCWPSRLPW